MSPSGCGTELAQSVKANLTLYLVQLASYDVAYHKSPLLGGLDLVKGCDEADVVRMLLSTCVTISVWDDPAEVQSPESLLSRVDRVRGVLGWCEFHQGKFDTTWPVFPILAKIHQMALQFAARVSGHGVGGDPHRLHLLLYEPQNMHAQNYLDEYLQVVWTSLQDGEIVAEDASLKLLGDIPSNFQESLDGNVRYGYLVAVFALLDCCSLRYAHLADEWWKLLFESLRLDMLLMPWPIWYFADRITLQETVSIRSSHPYHLVTLPRREKVSDYVRACRQPYCELAFFETARRLQISSLGATLDVIEAGANLGDCSMHLVASGLAHHAILFEPIDELVEHLHMTVNVNKWQNFVSIIPKAVGSSHGVEMLVQAGKRFGNSAEVGNKDIYADTVNKDQYVTSRPAPRILVPRTIIDDHHRGKADLIKISVPGKALDVLQGAKQAVSLARAVYFTIQPTYFEEPTQELRSLLQWLDTYGFIVDVVDGERDVAKIVGESVVRRLSHLAFFSLIAWRDLSARSIQLASNEERPLVPACGFR